MATNDRICKSLMGDLQRLLREEDALGSPLKMEAKMVLNHLEKQLTEHCKKLNKLINK